MKYKDFLELARDMYYTPKSGIWAFNFKIAMGYLKDEDRDEYESVRHLCWLSLLISGAVYGEIQE